MNERKPTPVWVRPATAPDETTMVLLQLTHGWILMPPAGARELAVRLSEVADEVEAMSSE